MTVTTILPVPKCSHRRSPPQELVTSMRAFELIVRSLAVVPLVVYLATRMRVFSPPQTSAWET